MIEELTNKITDLQYQIDYLKRANDLKEQKINKYKNTIDELEKVLNTEVLLRYRGKETGLYTKIFNEGGQLYREYILKTLKKLKEGKENEKNTQKN